jgi:uncharacterized protein with HEPN domain
MKKDDGVYLGHILDLAEKIGQRVANRSRDEFDANEDLRIVLTHLVQNIGEAARWVSQSLQELHPEIPWHDMIGMRHRIVHDYMAVDYEIVWDVVTLELPRLVEIIKPLVPPP